MSENHIAFFGGMQFKVCWNKKLVTTVVKEGVLRSFTLVKVEILHHYKKKSCIYNIKRMQVLQNLLFASKVKVTALISVILLTYYLCIKV